MKRIFYRKFSHRIDALDRFLAAALLVLDIVSIPDEKDTREEQIRDYYDRPILRAAIKAGADILLTGDKDFLEKAQLYAIINVSAFMQFPRIGGVFGFICVCPEYLSKNEEWSSFEYPVQQKGI